jgi:hypothetical protein
MHRRTTALPRRLSRLRRRLNGASGAIDLASIMVGVIIIGLLAGVLSASVFGVIPWTQDHAAQENLDGVKTAESIYRATTAEGGDGGRYADYPALVVAGKLPVSEMVNAAASAAGDCYAAVALSGTGNFYWNSSEEPQPRLYDSSDPDVASVCGGEIDLGSIAPVPSGSNGDGSDTGDGSDGSGDDGSGDGGTGGPPAQPVCVNWQAVYTADTGGRVAAITNTDARQGSLVEVSSDGGAHWAEHPELGKTDWTNVALTGNGGKMAIAQYQDGVNSEGKVWVSIDGGSTWVDRTPAADAWSRVGYSADGSTLVALAYNAVYLSHDDGVSWTNAHPGGSYPDFAYIAVTGDGSRVAITSTAGALYIWDGGGWVGQGARMWGPMDYANDGSILVGRVSGQQVTDVGTWVQDGSSPVVDQYNPDQYNVLAVALSGDGHRIITTGNTFSPAAYLGDVNGNSTISWTAGPEGSGLTGEWRSLSLDSDGSTIYVAASLWSSNHWNLLKSTDGGASFANITPQQPCKQLTPLPVS